MDKRSLLTVLLVAIAGPALLFAGSQGEAATGDEGPVVLTAFWNLDAKTGMTMKSYAEMTVFQEMERRTGVRFDFRHPPAGQQNEQFNLMLASNDLTDVVYWNWWNVAGGPGKVIGDGQILRLNELFDEHAPNYQAHLEAHPHREPMVTLDDGTHYMIPKFKHEKYVRISHGFQVREDMMQRLGLSAPTTIDEWHRMLTAFKRQDANGNGDPNDEIPFGSYDLANYSIRRFTWAWGVVPSFYLDGTTVRFGPIEDAYREHLATMNRWYDEGLIDPDWVSIDRSGWEAKVINNTIVSFAGLMNGHMGKFYGLKQDDPSFQLLGIQPPVGPAGRAFGPMNHEPTGSGLAVSATSKDPAAAVRWGDYLFTEEGVLLSNFGLEGQSWTYVDGEPTLTDLIKNNPEGLPMINAMSQHVWSAHDGPGLQLERTFKEIQIAPQINAVNTYQAMTDTSMIMPPAFPTPEEAERLAAIMNDIQTYVDETYVKFVLGAMPLSEFEQSVQTMERMGIDRALAIWQGVIDRYNSK